MKEAVLLTDDNRVVPLTLLMQAALSFLLALVVGLWQGKIAGVSLFVGGLVAVLPNAFLAARLLAPHASASAGALLRAAWTGELGKVALTALLFIAVFTWPGPISAPAVLGGFIAAQLVVFGALLVGTRGSSAQVLNKS